MTKFRGKYRIETARLKNWDYGWQERFYDHIIRDESSYQRIKTYIGNNLLNWENDKFYNKRQNNNQ